MRLKRTLFIVTAALTLFGLIVLSSLFPNTPSSYAFKLQEEGHDGITQEGIESIQRLVDGETIRFSEAAIAEIISANHFTDNASLWGIIPYTSYLHFDNETLSDGSARLVRLRQEILEALDPPSGKPDGIEAREQLGNALHTLQDFYAHSNWVEMDEVGNAPGIHFGYQILQDPLDDAEVCSGGDTLTDVGLNTLTTGYFFLDIGTSIGVIASGKCLHGLGPFAGIAKDTPNNDPNSRYQHAYEAARLATERFVEDILDDPRIANNPEAISAFMGVRGSLVVVIDVTTSMSQELNAVKSIVNTIVNTTIGTTNEPSEYILVTFGDPLSVGQIVVTSDPDYFLDEVNALTLIDGGNTDCPEYSFHGILDALSVSKGGSSMFVFTDANPKDSDLESLVIQEATEQETTIRFFVTSDSCSSSPIDPAYYRITQATLGQIFRASSNNLEGTISVIEPQLAGDVGLVQSEYGSFLATKNTIGGRSITIPIDTEVRLATFSIAVDNYLSEFWVQRPSGEIVSDVDPDVVIHTFNGAAVISITNPGEGDWIFYFNGTGNYSSLVSTNGPIRFTDFLLKEENTNRHDDMTEINRQPLMNQTYFVEAYLTGEITLAIFDLVSLNGQLIDSLTLNQPTNSVFPGKYVGDIQIPNQPFKVQVTGTDFNGNTFQRIYPTVFQPQTVDVSLNIALSEDAISTFGRNKTNTFVFTVLNLGESANFEVSVADDEGFVEHFEPTSLTLNTNVTATISVDIVIPYHTPETKNLNLSVTAINSADSTRRNYAILEVYLPPPPTEIYLPIITNNVVSDAPSIFKGVVTENGTPFAGTEMLLRYYNGSYWSNYDIVSTDSNGYYEFRYLPNLDGSRAFYVLWVNPDDNSNHLSSWVCWLIDSPSTDPNAYQCDFDVDNIELFTPSSGSTVLLPYTFSWNKRSTTSDTYRFILTDIYDYDPWGYTSLGYVNSYTLNSLPVGFFVNQQYNWWMQVYGPDGYGTSYYYRFVTFSNTYGYSDLQNNPIMNLLLKQYNEIIIPFSPE